MSTDSTNIIVTGGAGYIGFHTCRALPDLGWTTTCSDIETIIQTAWNWHSR